MPKFITDEEMAKLESSSPSEQIVSDEEMAKLESAAPAEGRPYTPPSAMEQIRGFPAELAGLAKDIGGVAWKGAKGFGKDVYHLPGDVVKDVKKPMESGKGIIKGLGNQALGMVNMLAASPGDFETPDEWRERVKTPLIKPIQYSNEDQERAGKNLGTGLTVASIVDPAIGLGGKAAGKLGKAAYMQEVGVLKPLAKTVAPTLKEAKQKIGDTIQKYKIDSRKGFNTASEKAEALFKDKWEKADQLIEEFSVKNPKEITDLQDVVSQAKKDVHKIVRPGERAHAENTIDNINQELFNELVDAGVDPFAMTPAQLVKAKRSIGAKYKNFNRSLEPVKEAAYDALETSVIKKINEYVPEAGALNIEARNIRFAKDAIEEAAGRNNKLGNWMAFGAEAVPALSYMMHDPSKALQTLAILGAVEGGRRTILSGRGASALMNAGRLSQKASLTGKIMSKPVRPITPFQKPDQLGIR